MLHIPVLQAVSGPGSLGGLCPYEYSTMGDGGAAVWTG